MDTATPIDVACGGPHWITATNDDDNILFSTFTSRRQSPGHACPTGTTPVSWTGQLGIRACQAEYTLSCCGGSPAVIIGAPLARSHDTASRAPASSTTASVNQHVGPDHAGVAPLARLSGVLPFGGKKE